MSRNNHHLFRMLAAFDVADYVRAFDVRQSLRREYQFHFHWALIYKIDNQVRVLGRNRAGRDFRRVIRVFCLPGVRDPIVRTTNGPNAALTLSRAALRSRSLSIRSRRIQPPSPPGPIRSSAARCCLRDAPPADKRNRCSTRLVEVVSDQPAFAVKKRSASPLEWASMSILQPATRFEPNCSPLSAQIRYKGDSANY